MIKEAIEKIVSLATPQTYEINGDTYATSQMTRIAPHVARPQCAKFMSLDGIVQALRTEISRDEIHKPVFVHVESPTHVIAFTTYRTDNMARDILYEASPALPKGFSEWAGHDDAIIMLRSQFVPNGDIDYLLDLLSRISSEDSVTSEDNGVSQKVSATVGVALKNFEKIKPRVLLAPFRTFFEVEQPESEFILRINGGDKESGKPPQIGIIEADGGAWKLAAKKSIADYFRKEISDLVTQRKVIVAE